MSKIPKGKGGRPKGKASPKAAAASRKNGRRRKFGPLWRADAPPPPAQPPPAAPAPEQSTAQQELAELDRSAVEADRKYQNARARLTGARARREVLKADREAGRVVPITELRPWLDGLATALRRVCDATPGMVESLDGTDPAQVPALKVLAKRLSARLRSALAGALRNRPGGGEPTETPASPPRVNE